MVRRLVSEGEDIGFLEDEEVDIDMLKRIANQIPNMSERTAARLYGVLDTEANRDKNGERVEPTNGDALVVYSTTTPFNARRWLNPRRFGETSHRLLEAYLKETGLVE